MAHLRSSQGQLACPLTEGTAAMDCNNEFSTTIDAAAARLGRAIVRVQVHDTAEIEPAISAFAAAPHGGLLLTGGGSRAYSEATRLALHYRLPLMYAPATPSTAEAEGVLMSHGADFLDLVRRAASYADRILRCKGGTLCEWRSTNETGPRESQKRAGRHEHKAGGGQLCCGLWEWTANSTNLCHAGGGRASAGQPCSRPRRATRPDVCPSNNTPRSARPQAHGWLGWL